MLMSSAMIQTMLGRGRMGCVPSAQSATGEVIGLEAALNDNLKALAGSKNFEDTVMSLSAAIHLLSTRLSDTADQTSQVDLKKPVPKGRAA